ncbi:MAG: hypothetical protein ACRDHW_01845, partial [Ktedonobacteraceae bacterium]
VPGARAEIEQAPRMAQSEALARITAAFSGVLELSRVGIDTRLKIFWLHFSFPDVARERYAALLTSLEEETGWRVYLHPHVHQKALLEAVRRLLPEQTNLTGKKTLLQETRTLHLSGTNLPGEQERQEIFQRFTQETGWSLLLDQAEVDETVG